MQMLVDPNFTYDIEYGQLYVRSNNHGTTGAVGGGL